MPVKASNITAVNCGTVVYIDGGDPDIELNGVHAINCKNVIEHHTYSQQVTDLLKLIAGTPDEAIQQLIHISKSTQSETVAAQQIQELGLEKYIKTGTSIMEFIGSLPGALDALGDLLPF